MIGESDTTGRSPSVQVLLLPCSLAAPATSAGAALGLAASTCICTLPSAPVSFSNVADVTNSHPSANSAGNRTSITDGARTQRLVARTLPPLGCLPSSDGSIPQSAPLSTFG